MFFIDKKYSLFIFLGLFSCFVFSEGFIAGTLVKTPVGYVAIEHLEVGNSVICFDGNNSVERPIINATSMYVTRYARIYIEDECIGVSSEQLFYDIQQKKWITVTHLKNNNFVLARDFKSHCIKAIEWIDESVEVYCLSIARNHNFLVSQAEVCAHNFPPIVISLIWAFGGGVVEWLSAGLGIAGLGGLYYKFGKESKTDVSLGFASLGSNMMLDDMKDNAQAPGKPAESDGYVPPKKWDGKKVKNPNGPGYGWPDRRGRVWVPTGPNGHGGPHWDVESPDGSYENVMPGGRIRGKK